MVCRTNVPKTSSEPGAPHSWIDQGRGPCARQEVVAVSDVERAVTGLRGVEAMGPRVCVSPRVGEPE